MEVWGDKTTGVLERPEMEPTVGVGEPSLVRDEGHPTVEKWEDSLAHDLYVGRRG